MTAVTASGRVLSVKPRDDGAFSVTLGPPPTMYWYITPVAPALGSEVVVTASASVVKPLQVGAQQGTMTVLAGAKQQVQPSKYATRMVAPAWTARAEDCMVRPLLPYQVTGAAWLAQRLAANQGSILADDPGLGKSAQTIAALTITGSFPAVVVCPSSVKVNWAREFQYSLAKPRVAIIAGRSGALKPADVYVLNYSLIKSRELQLQELKPKAVVFDEAHELKEPRATHSHRASVATRLAAWSRRVVLLTGSPIMNNPSEMWRLLHMADPDDWRFFEDFEMRYLKASPTDEKDHGTRIVTSRGRAEHLDELQARIQPLMLRRRKAEVQSDLPAKSRRSVLVDLDLNDRKMYQAAERDVIAWLQRLGHDEKAKRAARTIGLAKLTHLRRIAAIGKMRHAVPEYLAAWFAQPDQPPLVIFAYHRVVLDALFPMCAQLGIHAVGIGGDEDVATRQRAVDAFQSGQSPVFICPIKAGGVGINLHRASDSLVLERDWSPARMVQAEDRIHRLGQSKPVTITYLDAADTVDEHVAEVLAAKQTLIDHVVDGSADNAKIAVETIDTVLGRLWPSATTAA